MTDPLLQPPAIPTPANEPERLAALHRYKILDTPPEAAFDRITNLAARLFRMPIALISLVDESRAWFKSCVGFGASEVPRDATLCSFAVLTDEPLIIPDTRLDERFACNPFVQSEPGVRFYAGAPLISQDGFNLGTLCLLDYQPHDPLTPDQQATLVDLAAMVVDELELRLAAQKIAQVDAALLEITQGVSTVTGGAFLDALVQYFAKILVADYVYIGLVEGDDPPMIRTIATCAHGQRVENLSYPLHDTPCWEVIQKGQICCYPRNVQAQFPDAPLLAPLSIESYIAAPFFNARGTAIGLLGVMDRAPLENVHLAESLLMLFADRIATELERQHTEAALRQSESRFRLMVESAKEYAIFTLDLHGTVTSWNSGAERLLGYPETDIIGCDGRIIFTPEDQEQGQPEWEMQTALSEGQAANERWHVRKDGSRFWASGLMMPLQDDASTPQGFVKILQDKTAQRQADQRLQLLYETTSELLATEQPLALMNALFSKLSTQLDLDYYFNFLVAEQENQRQLHLTHHTDIPTAVRTQIERLEFGQDICGMAAQEQRQIVLNQRQIATHPNAQLAHLLGITAYACQPLIVRGRLLGTLSFGSRSRSHFTPAEIDLLQSVCDQMAIALDRTNLTASIQQQAERLQEANRIKDEFLAVLSHELRSPLNPILGWTRLLQTGRLDETRQREALATIERNAKLQTQLIEDLLDISRIMRGKLSLTVAPVSLTFVITAAVETVRLAAEAKHIAIELDLSPSVAPVSGDAARLQQVIWNLLTNAVKFTPRGGQVTVELRQLDQLAQIRVIDTGKGIDPEFLPYVFEYFRQADSSTTRKFGGLGLGLAIVRQIVELHGGTVTAESQGEAQGAVFTVQLPVLWSGEAEGRRSGEAEGEEPASMLPCPPAPSLPLTLIRVLVVDDETDTREFQAFVLQQGGAEVTAVASGFEALQVLDRWHPDVIVSDIGMAGMDGYMLMQQIRARSPNQGGQIPAIALTAYARDFDQQKALQAGFQAHITKPVEPEALVKAIVGLLSQSASAAASPAQ